jgi:hypothetical protein
MVGRLKGLRRRTIILGLRDGACILMFIQE